MKIKRLVAVLLSCILILSFEACERKDQAVSSLHISKHKSDHPVTISVTSTYAGTDGNAKNFQEAVERWERETGNKVNDASATSDETFKARVLADFETGSEPDVLFFFNSVDSNPFVEAELVVSIDEIRKEYPEYASNMKDSMLGVSPCDGKNYSVPVNGYWEALFVNKSVCERAGVAIPDATTTWEEFMEICQKIKDAGISPIAASLATIPHYWFEFCIYNYTGIENHRILPKSCNDMNGKSWIKGIDDIKDIYERGYFPENTLTSTDDETFQMFLEGKAAFLIDGSWKVGGIEEAVEDTDNFTVTYVPGKNKRKTTDIIGGLSSGYYITKKAWENPEKREAAVDFVTFMTGDEIVSKFAGVSVTALKNGVKVDASKLSGLKIDGYQMLKGATGMTGAVGDKIPTECRVPVFDGMPNLVTGKVSVEHAVNELLHNIYEK